MTNCSLINEYYALILLAILALFFYDIKPMRGFETRRRVFTCSLTLCAVTVLLNILSTKIDEDPSKFSAWMPLTVNTVYFFTMWLMLIVLGYYLLMRLYEFVYDSRSMRRMRVAQLLMFLVFAGLLVHNIESGILFYFDEAGYYCRGSLNTLCYMMPVCEVMLMVVCYLMRRRSINKMAEKLIFVITPISLLLLILQYNYQDHQINGIICVTVHLIVFITYSGGRTDQDSVTGMENRRYFITEVSYRLKNKQHFQLVMTRLRGLSYINRLYGENAGNVVLFEIGEALQQISEDGKVYRYGDDEFVLLFSDTDPFLCDARLQKVTQWMQRRWRVGKHEIPLTFYTIGMKYDGQPWSFDDVSTYMGDAMHQAVLNDIELMPFDESLIAKHNRRDFLLQTMHEALEENRFEVWYQPIYYHKSQKFKSAEALIRMFDKDGNAISPSEFIPVAEETGLIDELTLLVMERVCRLFASGAVPELQAISVNMPVRQLVDRELKKKLHGIIEQYGISPEQIRLEVTERDVEQNGDSAAEAMEELLQAGYLFMLDDFGIGYSNIARVMDMSLDCIKLDRSLVLQMQKDERHHNMIKNYLVPLLHQMGHYVVAEGVEDEEMLNLVLGCDINRIQGFYFAKPMPEDRLIEWYAERAA